jgi:L-threonylcarbamoyladenylate synthase
MSDTTIATQRLKPDDGVRRAAGALAAGGLVAFPTETVYGLGADATNAVAVARLFAAKGRPKFNPLIAHVVDVAAAKRLGVLDATAGRLAAAFWPGALTLVVRADDDCAVCELARAGLDTIAMRVPAHATEREPLGPCVAHNGGPCAGRS